jgi:hypothetical protein
VVIIRVANIPSAACYENFFPDSALVTRWLAWNVGLKYAQKYDVCFYLADCDIGYGK